MEWIDRLAEALGVPSPSPQQTTQLLSASREVAHRTERMATPLATYLLGASVTKRLREGVSPETAFADAIAVLLHELPDDSAGEKTEP